MKVTYNHLKTKTYFELMVNDRIHKLMLNFT